MSSDELSCVIWLSAPARALVQLLLLQLLPSLRLRAQVCLHSAGCCRGSYCRVAHCEHFDVLPTVNILTL